MATADRPQRAWRAACPNCGAPVEFASAASPVAVCSFCRSTLVRDGDALRRIGQSAELFDDHSPLQLGVAGRWQGSGFTLVGRLQLRYEGGSWNEWHALFDSGKSGWLSEDNGRYVMGFDVPTPPDAPGLAQLQPGAGVSLDARLWQVASVTTAQVAAAQGELPAPPRLNENFQVADLRNTQGEVGTLDFSEPAQPRWSVGRSAALADLALTGLQEPSEKTLSARGVECPSCGTALQIKLDTTKSIACHQCHAVVDVSPGVGGDLAHYQQGAPYQAGAIAMLPLGTTGYLALDGEPLPWQVVGYVERCELPQDPEDERVYWREYLLYNRETGFAFLVDAEDGWSWVVPLTGVPEVRGSTASWAGSSYSQRFQYTAMTTYVMGEFYWQLKRGERTLNTDYANGKLRLNREQAGREVTWSAGQTLDGSVVAVAFKVPGAAASGSAAEASPFSAGASSFRHRLVLALIIGFILFIIFRSCSSSPCDELRNTFGASSNEYQQCLNSNRSGGGVWIPRTGGGSFGGYGSGGGHK